MRDGVAINPALSAQWYYGVDEPFTTAQLIGRADWEHSEFYRRVVAPHGYYDSVLAILAKSGTRFGTVSLPFRQVEPAEIDAIVERFRPLAPHLRRAVMIADLLDARALQAGALTATLDMLTVGIVLTDERARVVHVNRAGQELMETTGGLRRDGDFITANEPRAARELRDSIAAAAAGGALPRTGIAVPIESGSGRDLAVWVLPLDGGLRGDLAAPFAARVALFVREIGDTTPFTGELFIRRYGITPAECWVLMLLMQGMGPSEVAACLGSALPTVKTHLSRLFEKTGTQGEADLVRLAVSALAPAIGV